MKKTYNLNAGALMEDIKATGLTVTRFSTDAGLSHETLRRCIKRNRMNLDTARCVGKLTGQPCERYLTGYNEHPDLFDDQIMKSEKTMETLLSEILAELKKQTGILNSRRFKPARFIRRQDLQKTSEVKSKEKNLLDLDEIWKPKRKILVNKNGTKVINPDGEEVEQIFVDKKGICGILTVKSEFSFKMLSKLVLSDEGTVENVYKRLEDLIAKLHEKHGWSYAVINQIARGSKLWGKLKPFEDSAFYNAVKRFNNSSLLKGEIYYHALKHLV